MTGHIRDRATFEALAQRPRLQRGPLTLRFLPGGCDARVAYAIGRNAGAAVQRNRIRRRLRAVVTELERDGTLVAGAYLLGAGAPAMTMPPEELTSTLRGLVAEGTEAHS